MEKKYFVGADLHKDQTWFYVMDNEGKKIISGNVDNENGILEEFFKTIPKPFEIGVESTYNWYFFVDIAEKYADKVHLANSSELKAFAKRHKKNDKIDAQLIAKLLSRGDLPEVYIPHKEIRKIKELLRYRMNIVKERTKNIAKLKALLARNGLPSEGNYTTYKGIQAIKRSGNKLLDKIIDRYANKILELTKEKSEIEDIIEEIAERDVDIKNLKTIPGIDSFSAVLIKSEIGEIERFATFEKLKAYAGLISQTWQSSKKTIYGPLNKNRNKYLQWILIEIVQHFIASDEGRKKKYERIKRKKNHNIAKISLAKDMLLIIYKVLKEKREYYEKKEKVA
jgi:transposase